MFPALPAARRFKSDRRLQTVADATRAYGLPAAAAAGYHCMFNTEQRRFFLLAMMPYRQFRRTPGDCSRESPVNAAAGPAHRNRAWRHFRSASVQEVGKCSNVL